MTMIRRTAVTLACIVTVLSWATLATAQNNPGVNQDFEAWWQEFTKELSDHFQKTVPPILDEALEALPPYGLPRFDDQGNIIIPRRDPRPAAPNLDPGEAI